MKCINAFAVYIVITTTVKKPSLLEPFLPILLQWYIKYSWYTYGMVAGDSVRVRMAIDVDIFYIKRPPENALISSTPSSQTGALVRVKRTFSCMHV